MNCPLVGCSVRVALIVEFVDLILSEILTKPLFLGFGYQFVLYDADLSLSGCDCFHGVSVFVWYKDTVTFLIKMSFILHW
jgi:hypothetical protein